MVERIEVVVRPAQRADLPALEWEGRYKHYRGLYRRAMDEADKGRGMLLVAEIAGRVVGQIFLQYRGGPATVKDTSTSGYLYSFRVRPEFRNQGVGTRLIERAETELRRAGLRRVLIAVAKENQGALRLYRRLGYSAYAEDPGEWSYIDHQGRLRRVIEPAFVLEKSLSPSADLN